MDEMKSVTFNEKTLKKFIKAANKCEAGKEFTFEGNVYLKEYAMYLIEHLKTVFKKVSKELG